MKTTKTIAVTILALGYLLAIISANLSSVIFGPKASVLNAFVFIGFDLTCRDRLHETWKNKYIILKMGILILIGSIISWAINSGAGRIALASMIAFVLSAIIDALVYGALFKRRKFIKINGSNIASAITDSIIFPTIAFGAFMPIIILGQVISKIAGGFLWSIIISKRNKP